MDDEDCVAQIDGALVMNSKLLTSDFINLYIIMLWKKYYRKLNFQLVCPSVNHGINVYSFVLARLHLR